MQVTSVPKEMPTVKKKSTNIVLTGEFNDQDRVLNRPIPGHLGTHTRLSPTDPRPAILGFRYVSSSFFQHYRNPFGESRTPLRRGGESRQDLHQMGIVGNIRDSDTCGKVGEHGFVVGRITEEQYLGSLLSIVVSETECQEPAGHGQLVICTHPRIHMDRADLGYRSFLFAYPLDALGIGKRQSRLFLGEVYRKVEHTTELVPSDPGSLDLRQDTLFDVFQNSMVIGYRLFMVYAFEVSMLFPKDESSVFTDNAIDGPLACDKVAPAGWPPGYGHDMKTRLMQAP